MNDPSLLLSIVPSIVLFGTLIFCDYRKPVVLLWFLLGTVAMLGASDLPLEMRRFFAGVMVLLAALQMWRAHKASRSS